MDAVAVYMPNSPCTPDAYRRRAYGACNGRVLTKMRRALILGATTASLLHARSSGLERRRPFSAILPLDGKSNVETGSHP